MGFAASESDLILTIGLGIAIFAIPAAFSAFSDERPPRVASVAMVLALGLVVLALVSKPGGYRLRTIPDAVAATIARVLNY
ncbi:MAG: hypothetical protein H5U24_19180 [Thioclava marina]|jgi:hypothetical protein|uniref:50S ribosomal protein L35 n=1 Tax=Thioclava marina TaxID=1915077 RepID=A0ABX3MPX7_9RHOB|nr:MULTISPECIES: hypothetical protein [Thioclava]TNE93299.1 MAG: hypothetical protein EP337_03825 [Paracoccaceae bacterium]MBC7147491.1 hypothetical protein [Thioclava marina]OOY13276.1 hypothetical protein BMG00_05640 [Thioclava marina]OOY28986.1 hypothetical protein BMI90_01540 [Thioclava sp. L04-15]TNF10344.1 MAG: hypothetical protein EP320_17800 [Paracoccaceae bacterium]